MDDTVRKRYLALFRAGRIPDVARQLDADFSLEEYQKTLQEPEFDTFCKEYSDEFMKGVEGMLLGRLWAAAEALTQIGPTHANYPQIMREYRQLLELTQPIIAKMAKVTAESFPLNLVELHIEGISDKQPAEKE